MPNAISTVLIASASFIIGFLFSRWYERRTTRTMLRLEIESNWAALQAFWQGINGLDTEGYDGKSHLAAMGLFDYPMPQWSWLRWQGLTARAVSDEKYREVDRLHHLYLEVSDVFKRLVNLTPEEQAHWHQVRERKGTLADNNWVWTYGASRIRDLERLEQLIQQIGSIGNPLSSAQHKVSSTRASATAADRLNISAC